MATSKSKEPAAPKRASKGKRHPLTANSLDRIADDLAHQNPDVPLSAATLRDIFRSESVRVRTILR